MIPLAKHQLAQALHSHYRAARRVEKAQILDAFVKATGYHRNYAIALLHHGTPQRRPERRGRPARYGAPVVETLRRLWEASGYLCSKRLRPFLAPLLATIERCGELTLSPPVKTALVRMSAATIDRKARRPSAGPPTPRAHHHPPAGAAQAARPPSVPLPSGMSGTPAFTELDLVGHCGESTHGEHVQSLSVVDIATAWFEARAVVNRSQRRVFAALTTIRERLPFPLRGIDADNDSAFINANLIAYCHAQSL